MPLDLQVVRYSSDGVLVMSFNGKRFKYYDVPPFQKEKIKTHLFMHDTGSAVKLLKRYSRPDLYLNMKHGYSKHEEMEVEDGEVDG